MKRITFVVMVLLLFSVTSCSQMNHFSKKASTVDNINGKWLGVMEEMNDMKLTFTFKVEKDILTGSVMSEMGDMPISNGKVMEDSFSFDVTPEGQVMPLICTYSEADDTITMEVPVMQNSLKLTRIAE